jgi:hypothetical protein
MSRMFKESTNIGESHLRALLGRDITKRYPHAPLAWLAVATDINLKNLQCKYLGNCKGMGIKSRKSCCRKRRCFRSCT